MDLRRWNSLGLCTLATVLCVACSFDYRAAAIEGERRAEVPQVEIFDAVSVVARENRLELRAKRIAIYPERRVQEMDFLTFSEFGPAGDLRLDGSADHALLDLDSEDIELSGNIVLNSRIEGARLESQFLRWSAKERVLTGKAGDRVRVRRDDGSYVVGGGFRVDGRRNSVFLSDGVEGVYETD